MNVKLSRRVGAVMGADSIISMDPIERNNMADAVSQAETFEALPKAYQAIILEAERQLGIKNPVKIQFRHKGA